MSRTLGTVVRGVRAPIFREGDDIVAGTVEAVLTAMRENKIEPQNRDVVPLRQMSAKKPVARQSASPSLSSAETAFPCCFPASPVGPKRWCSCSPILPMRWGTI